MVSSLATESVGPMTTFEKMSSETGKQRMSVPTGTGFFTHQVSTVNQIQTDYNVFIYKNETCFVESNIEYVTDNAGENFLEFYSKSKEQCCFDCNKLPICLSWSYDVLNQSCTLKSSFRANPTLKLNVFSGFKPNGLFSFTIINGVLFKNVDNPIYTIFNKPLNSLNGTERGVYEYIKLDLTEQVSLELFNSNILFALFYFILLKMKALITSQINFTTVVTINNITFK